MDMSMFTLTLSCLLDNRWVIQQPVCEGFMLECHAVRMLAPVHIPRPDANAELRGRRELTLPLTNRPQDIG